MPGYPAALQAALKQQSINLHDRQPQLFDRVEPCELCLEVRALRRQNVEIRRVSAFITQPTEFEVPACFWQYGCVVTRRLQPGLLILLKNAGQPFLQTQLSPLDGLFGCDDIGLCFVDPPLIPVVNRQRHRHLQRGERIV